MLFFKTILKAFCVPVSVLLWVALCCCSPAAAQEKSLPIIHLLGQSVQANQLPARWLDSMSQAGALKSPAEVLITFETLPNEDTKSLLQINGVFLNDFMGDLTYTAIFQAVSPLVVEKFGITSLMPVMPECKMTTPAGLENSKDARVIITCHNHISQQEFVDKLETLGGTLKAVLVPEQNVYEVSLSHAKHREMAVWQGVRSLSVIGKTKPTNFESGQLTRSSMAHLPIASGGYGLLGDSITVGVGDNTSGLYHIDVRDRIINYNPHPFTNHGQHVNGVVGATGTMDRRGEGMAPHTMLVNHKDDFVWQRTGAMLQAHNMTATNNSYTAIAGNCGYAGTYDAFSQAMDAISLQYPSVLHVFAAGNDGDRTCSPYPAFFGTVTGTYQPAKNILTVGQCDKIFTLGINSSRGPVQDGRIKPEIVAVGTGVISTRNNDIYLTNGGTSQAAPMVTGAAALLQQRYKQKNAGTYPSAALVKALLMNGATDKGNPGPDYSFGFGLLNVDRSLKMVNGVTHYTNTISSGGANQDVTRTVPSATAKLKVMLYWADPAASLGSMNKLVNNLDLEVFAPSAPSTAIRPLILNSSASGVNDSATNGVDSKNNVEQVVIDNPAAGSYKIRVKATSIPSGPQQYVVVYDFLPNTLALTYPTLGAQVATHIPMRIFWDDDVSTPSSYKLEVSDDDGVTWTVLDGFIFSTSRTFQWSPPTTLNSEKCKMRITRNNGGQQFTTGRFVINSAPLPVLDAVQCPGYVNYRWPSIPNATAYQIIRKKGFYLENETIITDTFYSFSGLSLDSTYYVAVQPIINGVSGYRSQSLRRKPSDGTCVGPAFNGDLMIEALESPVSGRQFTSSQLGTNTLISVRIRNLDDVAATNFSIAYKLNNNAWQSQSVVANIAPNSSSIINIPTSLDLSATGNYSLIVAVTNLALTDNVPKNDTIRKTIRHLLNAPININTGFTENFESETAYSVIDDSLGITSNQRWDYQNSNDTGKLYSFVNSDITISGNRSLSMSNKQAASLPVSNMLTGTFNTAAYSVASSELRLEFDYKMHGNSNFSDSNKVWVRAADSLAWIPIFSYQRKGTRGVIRNSGSISLSDAIANSGKNFTTSMQVRFGQQDSTVIALNNYGAGLTLDNIKLYTVQNDVLLDSIVAPKAITCEANGMAVAVRVFNGVTAPQSNVEVSYRIDNGTIYTETIASLPGKTKLIVTFPQTISGLGYGLHTLKTWVKNNGDTYTGNDTLVETFRNQQLITSFPSIQNFETNNGNFYSEGSNSSWQYGIPASFSISQAASGTKAWKTNLTGTYNSDELSYLYSPCYSIGSLVQPMLSFSAIVDIEYCGNPVCDAAWVEYSTNGGVSWSKLGATGQGYNWYTSPNANVWDAQAGVFRWHVASIPLPVTTQPLTLRFVLSTDEIIERQGLAIDDIHIYDRTHEIYNGTTSPVVSQLVNGNVFSSFASGGKLAVQINPLNQNLTNCDIVSYSHSSVPNDGQKYFLPRSFVLQSDLAPADSVLARFYVPDADVTALLNATSCNSCSKPIDIYRTGIAKYDDITQITENGSLTDNIVGTWSYYNYNKIKWVPYDNGYYAELKLRSFSEIWFSDVTLQVPLPVDLLHFSLTKQPASVRLNWELQQPANYKQVTLQRSNDGKLFTDKYQPLTVLSQQSYLDESPAKGSNYYRLMLTAIDGKVSYSKILSATFGGEAVVSISPNPANETIHISWEDAKVPAAIQLHNTFGQVIYYKLVTGGNQWRIDANNFAAGIYTLTWKQEGQVMHRQLHIVH